tara:strand:+ start:3746 stop:4711 length:966 start_codon:yes stop_codon:yes gene_type:complete
MNNKAFKLYIILTGIFVASLVTCNLIANKFVTIDLGFKVFVLSAGVLPYPITFLITDILSEIYGKKLTNMVVISGFVASLFVLLFLWLGAQPNSINMATIKNLKNPDEFAKSLVENGAAQSLFYNGENTELSELSVQDNSITFRVVNYNTYFDQKSNQDISINTFPQVKSILETVSSSIEPENNDINIDMGTGINNKMYDTVFQNAWRVIAASMIAYLSAQFLDVRLFHFWKNLTKGRHLWLRNNASTIASQLVDTTLVVLVLFAGIWPMGNILQAIIDGWIFKMLCAFIDTPIFYGITAFLRNKFKLNPAEEVDLFSADI